MDNVQWHPAPLSALPLDISGTCLTMTAQYTRPGAFTVFQITAKLRTEELIFPLP